MPSLEAAQINFIETINKGPDALDPLLFGGPADRILLGLAAHANTINHARLVAMEATFPLTREHMGDAEFNTLARIFVETADARSTDNNNIGAGFADFIGGKGAALQELVRIEWAWLQSYHAPEAEPLSLAELGGMDEVGLLTLPITLHPSARLVETNAKLSPTLGELANTRPAGVLAIRPDTEVRLVPLNAVQLAVINAASKENAVLGNLLGAAIETAGGDAPLTPVMDLIGEGALVKA